MRTMSSIFLKSRWMRTPGKHKRALVVDVAGEDEIARRDGVADVGHVALGNTREEMLAFEEDGHHVGVVGRVRVAAIGVVVEIGVAAADVRVVIPAHVRRLDVTAEDVDGQPLGRREQLDRRR